VIAVTGTKGKSTTASWLAHILGSCGHSVNLAGNIGHALITSGCDYDYVILEASSFQIYDGNIKADIAVVTNLFAEHVDWHDGQENYFRDKLKLIKEAKIKIINATNDNLNAMVNEPDLIYFNHKKAFHVQDKTLYYQNKELLCLSEIKLMGVHNLQNIGAALTVCQQLKLDIKDCIKAVKGFQPLAHRLQNLGRLGKCFAIMTVLQPRRLLL